MPIGLATKPTDDQLSDSSSPSAAEPYNGAAKSSRQLRCRAQRPNTRAQNMSIAGDADLQHISTSLQMADIFMKALGADKLWQFKSDLGLSPSNLPILRESEPVPKAGAGIIKHDSDKAG